MRHYLTTFSFGNCKIWFSSLKMTWKYSCCHGYNHSVYYSSEASHRIGVPSNGIELIGSLVGFMFINLCIGIGQKLPFIWSNAATKASFPLSSFCFTFSLVSLTSAFKHTTNNKTTCISFLSKIILLVTSSTEVHFKQKYTLFNGP